MRIGLAFPLQSGAAILAGAGIALSAAVALAAGDNSATPATRSSVKATEETVTLNFVNADVEAVVRAIGQYTGRSFVIDPRVKGTMTLVTEHPVTRRQAYEELLSALRLQGFTLVESPDAGGVARVVLEADAKLQGGRVLAPATTTPRGDQVITQVFRLQYESASNLVPVLRPLIAPNNTIAAYAANNTLVITDYAENLRRLAHIIEAIDSPTAADVVVVPLKYGLATDIATIVTRVLEGGAGSGAQSVDAGQRIVVQAEPRSNSLIIRAASRARIEQAKALIAQFDQPSATPGNINVIYLRNAQATKMAPLLRAVLSSDPSFMSQAGGTISLSGGGAGGMGAGLSGTSGSSNALASGGSGFGGPATPNASGPAATPSPSSSYGATGGGGSPGGLSGMIQADPATNSLIISGPEPLYRNIRAIVDKLDVRPAQVLIESLVVELSGDKSSEFGIQWQSLNGLNNSGTSVVGGTNFGNSSQNIISGAESLGNLGQGLNIGVIKGTITVPGIGSITNIALLARALETTANANILQRPNIQTLDNEEGKFLVGQNVPIVTGSYANTGTVTTTNTGSTVTPFQTYQRQDVGMLLRVKPQVSEGGSVRLTIYIEDSSVSSGTSGTELVLNKQSFETSVMVEDGSFVVISGMISDQTNENQYKVPLLGDIPLLGYLFRYDTREHIKTQTMVFLRPTVIRDEAASGTVASDRYDYIRNALAQAQPEHHPVLGNYGIAPLPPMPAKGPPGAATAFPGTAGPDAPIGKSALAPTPAAPVTQGADEQIIEVATVDTIVRARQLQQQLKNEGLDAYWEAVDTPAGHSVRVRVTVTHARHNTQEALVLLRGLGYSPSLVSAGQVSVP
ncbi:Type II and III secretion system protein [Burkholderiales bacterium]|jgi:general secretion pathway protein D|nr:Type II and III secretion system protein [Burkholderiales bacterium]